MTTLEFRMMRTDDLIEHLPASESELRDRIGDANCGYCCRPIFECSDAFEMWLRDHGYEFSVNQTRLAAHLVANALGASARTIGYRISISINDRSGEHILELREAFSGDLCEALVSPSAKFLYTTMRGMLRWYKSNSRRRKAGN